MLRRDFNNAVVLSLLVLTCAAAVTSAQSVYPTVDHDSVLDPMDGDCDTFDRAELVSLIGSNCSNFDDWLYDFDLDGCAEYQTYADEDAALLDVNGIIEEYRFYWCVKDLNWGEDQSGPRGPGHWHYQMDNTFADDTSQGHTPYPTEVVEEVAIFDASKFGYWPTFRVNGSDYGGLHCLLQPTPDSSYDNTNTWQAGIRRRMEVQGLDPDDDVANYAHPNNVTTWDECWAAYLQLHRERVAEAIDELCGLSALEDFDGYGVVDYEGLQFDWDLHDVLCGSTCDASAADWRTFVAGLNQSAIDWDFLNFMDGTQWDFTAVWSGSQIWANLVNKEQLYEKSWNYFMHLLVMETLDACRGSSEATALWGFWGYPRKSNDLSATFDVDVAAVNANLSWLWDLDDNDDTILDDAVDMLLPSLYARHATVLDTSGCTGQGCNSDCYTLTNLFYRTNVVEMCGLRDTYNGSALVLPFVWRGYSAGSGCEGVTVNEYVAIQQFMLPKFYGADGVMIWDSIDRRDMDDPTDAAAVLEDLVDVGGAWREIIEREHWE